MILRGRAWEFGDDINTDVIIPTHYCTTIDPEFWAQHCMEGLDLQFQRCDGFYQGIKKRLKFTNVDCPK